MAPIIGVVGEDDFVVGGEIEINFEDAVAEVIIQEEGFIGIGISVAVDGAHSVSDIRVVEPRVIEIIGFGVARDDRGGLVGRGFGVWGAEVLENDGKESGAESDAKDNDNGNKNRVRCFFFHIFIL